MAENELFKFVALMAMSQKKFQHPFILIGKV